ncbi:Alpha-D-ribose 1-methylphosphonate 5-triphosphate synthase subunit PhnH [Vibrio thalassae]|uniref:Alpha-D-ribose 1-methylphosphonate 5-triphosphate synthase subunit PhnH n=1 Tax=Vibrio thalassae TaxID=1243014 RepID=A0A240ENI5_9VIBR|nr:phosphonate C-P lyase system protein PhnH [Vibrio thalassae]SNX49565.1 Alpha-D-ribose 1-methylphosphonate 5-triphosphate synthase subunit PhnH [Vibrio thalassae]
MTTITTAFEDAVHDSQQCFRLLLKAMSEPGEAVTLDLSKGFGSMHKAATQTLLSLSDNATPIWLSESHLKDAAIRENIRFHCGSPVTEQQNSASFAVIAEQDLADFDWNNATFSLGCEEYPDQSTTVIVELGSLANGSVANLSKGGITLTLTGPGIESQSVLNIGVASKAFQHFLQGRQEHFAFPLGIDLILVNDESIACLPRTTLVEVNSCM